MPHAPSWTDLTEREWAVLRPLLPPAKVGGRPREQRSAPDRERDLLRLRVAQRLPLAPVATRLSAMADPDRL
jgi:hypothetical protein